jgi:hypothetical protein
MSYRANVKMNRTSLNIVAKQNKHEIYLIAYKHKENIGFVSDLEQGIRYADDKVQSIRKKGFWIDIHCSENIAKSILEKVVKCKTKSC